MRPSNSVSAGFHAWVGGCATAVAMVNSLLEPVHLQVCRRPGKRICCTELASSSESW